MAHQHSFLDWVERHLFTCPFKANFGFDCPGCGFQRSIIALMKGDFLSSFRIYPAAIPFILILLFTLIHLKIDFKIGAKVIKIAYGGVAIIILINYIYKIFTSQLIS